MTRAGEVFCWRRFSEWTELSVWSNLHALLLSQLGKAGAINLQRAVIDSDSASIRAVFGAHTCPNPTDRAKAGCQRHVLTDAEGIPLAVRTTPANVRDDRVAWPLLVNMPAIAGPKGRPRTKPKALQGDAGYGSAALAALVKWLGIKPILAPLGKARIAGSGLGKTRYVVERTLSWFGNFRRLKLC